MGEAVGGAGDEGLEGEAGLEAERPARGHGRRARLLGLVAGRLLGRGHLDDDLDLEVAAAHLEEGVPQQREVALADPLAQQLAVNGEHEALVVEDHGPRPGERELVGLAVEGAAQPIAHLVPDGVALGGRGGDR